MIRMKKKIKVITKDLKVKDVSLGYYRNYLAPQGLVRVATKEAIKNLEMKKKILEEERQKKIAEYQKKAKDLEKTSLEFKAEASVGGKLFGSITAKDVEKELKDKNFGDVTVEMKEPIKEVGDHEIVVDFGEGVKSKVKVSVKKTTTRSTSQ